MSRDFVRSALLPSGPCPPTILVSLSASERIVVGGGNHAVDFAARTGVDVGVHTVEKRVAHLNQLAF